jgi:hypothetical protein
MADTPKKLVVDLEKGTHEYVDFTPAEIAQRERDAVAAAELRAQEEADAAITAGLKASAKAKLVSGEPLTEAEAATLVI